MAIPRIAYHTEETWIQAIHLLAKSASVCRVAVAYCGEEAYKFFPEAPAERPEDLRIIVDASETAVRRGLTNPKGIEHLLGFSAKLKTLTALHAKVFIFDQRAALVGSTNMSRSAINQYQMGLEIWDRKVVRQLIAWFDDELWESKEADCLNSQTIDNLMPLWPSKGFTPPVRKGKAKLPWWKGEAPSPPLDPSDIKIVMTTQSINQLLADFKNNECPYRDNGTSCFEAARDSEEKYGQLGKQLNSLWRRRNSWDKKDLEQLFDIAYYNGRAAKIRKPEFVRQQPRKVARSIGFLLEGLGDPYIRFEKLLAAGSSYKLHGLGEAGVIFLMYLWKPMEFAIINKPVDDALNRLVKFSRSMSVRKGQGFKDRTAAVSKIAKLTRLETFGRVDHFLDAIGKGHIG
jgi:hypothetical protein